MTPMIPVCRRLRAHRLAEANDLLAHWAVGRFLKLHPGHPDYDDAVQEARIALLDAGTGFNSEYGSAFATYAGRTLCNRLSRFYQVRQRHGFTRLGDGGKGWTPGESKPPIELTAELQDMIVRDAPEPSANMDQEDLRRKMSLLSARDRQVLHSRFWLGETLADLALRLGICKERARQLQCDAIDRLRVMMGMEDAH